MLLISPLGGPERAPSEFLKRTVAWTAPLAGSIYGWAKVAAEDRALGFAAMWIKIEDETTAEFTLVRHTRILSKSAKSEAAAVSVGPSTEGQLISPVGLNTTE